MHPQFECPWDVTPQEAERTQLALAARVTLQDALPATVRTVAGLDVAYSQDSPETFAAVVVLDAQSLRQLELRAVRTAVAFPYIPGLFSFREIPAIAAALAQLNSTPDLFLCDGHGIAHPRRLGLASHLGLLYDVPSIGCAKTRFFGHADPPGPHRGDAAPILDAGEVIGAALRTQHGVKPLYVSTGHRVSLQTACHWVLRLSPKYRSPEPLRAANTAVQTMKARAAPR
ncbi:MAG: deoxyribonuclease V [Bryobacterales bacterium]|nr:deoxyribonuclease V [Bryobacterales bacterium]